MSTESCSVLAYHMDERGSTADVKLKLIQIYAFASQGKLSIQEAKDSGHP